MDYTIQMGNIEQTDGRSDYQRNKHTKTDEQKLMMTQQPTHIKHITIKKDIHSLSSNNTDSPKEVQPFVENTSLKTPDNIVSENRINTDSEVLSQNSMSSCHNDFYEFSISTLDRKLREIKRIKKTKKNRFTYSKKKNKHISRPVHILSPLSSYGMSDSFRRDRNVDELKIDLNQVIREHLREIQLRIVGHTRATMIYEKKDKIIGYPVTILSSFLTSSIMLTLTSGENAESDIIKYISLTLSVLSFLFSVSRDYLNYSKKFQSHDLSSKLYTTLFRSIEVRLINETSQQENRDIFHDIVNQMSIIEQYETPIPEKIDRTVRENINDIISV